MKLDPETLRQVLDGISSLARSALETSNRERFEVVERLARVSSDLLAIDEETSKARAFIPGLAPSGLSGADSAGMFEKMVEVLGPLIESQKEKTLSDKRTAQAQELASMIDLKRTLEGDDTSEIDARIDFLRKEMEC